MSENADPCPWFHICPEVHRRGTSFCPRPANCRRRAQYEKNKIPTGRL